VPALVPRGALAAANGRLELARSAAFAAGPALAGALVGWMGATPAFALAAALSAAAVILLAGVHEPARAALPVRHVMHDVAEGARFVMTHPLLRPVLLTAAVFNTSFFVLQAVYVPYAVHHLGLSATGVGATLASYGVGMVAGAVLAPRISRHLAFGTVVAIGPVAGFAAAVVMVLTIAMPSLALAAASFFLIGAGPVLWLISSTTLRQSVTPEHLLGRVSAVLTTATWGCRPIGSAIGAVIGSAFGAQTCIVVAALGFLVQAAIILASPVPRLVRQPVMTAS
jgi:predicted MFS family arabinose efflux permease